MCLDLYLNYKYDTVINICIYDYIIKYYYIYCHVIYFEGVDLVQDHTVHLVLDSVVAADCLVHLLRIFKIYNIKYL